MDINELYHYGVGHDKGGRSGRYPWGSGKNGKLSARKQKQAKKLAEKYAKITGKKLVVKKSTSNKQPDKPKAKTISEMSNQEIQDKINRINLERTLIKLTTPQQSNKKKTFIESIKDRFTQQKNDVFWPSVTDAGRQTLTNYLKDQGKKLLDSMKPGDPNFALRNQVTTKELEARLAKAMNTINREGMSAKEWNKSQKILKNNSASKKYTRKIMRDIGSQTSSSVLSGHRYTAAKTATRNTINKIMANNNLMKSITSDRSKLFSTIENNNDNREIVYKAMKSFEKKYKNYNPIHKSYNIKGFRSL